MNFAKPNWTLIGEMLLMVAFGALIFLVPKFNDAGQNGPVELSNSDQRSEAPATSADLGSAPLAYIDHALTEISSWEVDRIEPLLAQPTQNEVSRAELGAVATTLKYSLGELKSYSHPVAIDSFHDTVAHQARDVDAYLIDAVYESGSADVVLHIVEEHGRKSLWKLDLSLDDDEP